MRDSWKHKKAWNFDHNPIITPHIHTGSKVSICRQNHKAQSRCYKLCRWLTGIKNIKLQILLCKWKINHKNKVIKIKLCLLSPLSPFHHSPPTNCKHLNAKRHLGKTGCLSCSQKMTQMAWNKSRSNLSSDPYFLNAMVPSRFRFWVGDKGYFSEFV